MAEEEVEKTKVKLEVADDLFLSPDDSIAEETPISDVSTSEVGAVEEEPDALALMEEKVLAAEKERDDFKNRMMRAAADLENFRRRANREKDELRKYGIDKIVGELLPVLDNFERALEHSEDTASFIDGVEMIYKQFVGSLEKHGVKGFEAVGEKFLPQLHEAIQQVETDEQEPGHVVAQFQKGYHLHDRLVRAALVSVAKAVTKTEIPPDDEVETAISDVEQNEDVQVEQNETELSQEES